MEQSFCLCTNAFGDLLKISRHIILISEAKARPVAANCCNWLSCVLFPRLRQTAFASLWLANFIFCVECDCVLNVSRQKNTCVAGQNICQDKRSVQLQLCRSLHVQRGLTLAAFLKYLCLPLTWIFFFSGGNVTALGRKMTDFPLSPGLSRTVILSASLGCEDLLLPVAAMLSVENVFVSPGGKKNLSLATQIRKELAEEAGGTNDFATLLYIYKQCHSRWVIVTERPKPQERLTNRPYSYSQYWTGTSLQWRLMRGKLFKCKCFLIYSPA